MEKNLPWAGVRRLNSDHLNYSAVRFSTTAPNSSFSGNLHDFRKTELLDNAEQWQRFTCSKIPTAGPTQQLGFYTFDNSKLDFKPPQRPIRVVFLTSIRDVGKTEHVGSVVETAHGARPIKGSIETVLSAIRTPELSSYVEVAAIITDDMPKDLQGSGYGVLPSTDSAWIHPLAMRNQAGDLITDVTFNIPSVYRSLPINDIKGRATKKLLFEEKIYNLMKNVNADILVSDHFMGKIENLIVPNVFGLYGRVLNTHPGITRRDYPYRCIGAEPEQVALLHSRGLVHDKQGNLRECLPHTLAGASFHVISDKIDKGPVLCDIENTYVDPNFDSISLIYKLYKYSKNPVIVNGLKHYAAHIFPLLS